MIMIASYVNSATDKVQAFNDALDFLIGLNVSTQEALLNVKDAVDSVTQSFKQNGVALDNNSVKGKANQRTVLQMIDAAKQYAQAVYQQALKTHDAGTASVIATKAFWLQVNALLANKTITDKQREAIRLYLAKLGLIPPKKSTTISTPGLAQAAQGIADLVKGFKQLPTKVGPIPITAILQLYSSKTNPKGINPDLGPLGTLYQQGYGNPNKMGFGGFAHARVPVIVGDMGRPEVFIPDSKGYIYPDAREFAKKMGAAGEAKHITIAPVIHTQEINPIKHAADLGWETARRMT
jgi:hypothetical protein